MNLLQTIKGICGRNCQGPSSLTVAHKKNILSFFVSQMPDVRQIRLFGLVMAINFPLYWLIWGAQTHDSMDNFFRLTAFFLCIGLVAYSYRPTRCPKLYVFFWYGVVTFCLPFFFAFMTLKNHGSALWFMNCMSALFFNLILMPVSLFLFVSMAGILGAFLCFHFLLPPFYFDLGIVDLYGLFWTFFAAVTIGGLFAYRKDQIQGEKIQILKSFSSNIIQETHITVVQQITTHLSRLLEKHSNKKKGMSKDDAEYMMEFVDDIRFLTNRVDNILNMTLSNLQEDLTDMPREVVSARNSLFKALKDYPFFVNKEDQIKIIPKGDFSFRGNADLMQHVFLNLIHNSLYFINKTGNGKIIIEINPGALENTIIFKDTSVGIRPEFLPKVFEAFQSDRPHGTGIGLAFCKRAITAMGGTIVCDSVLGKHTTFTITFRD